jgi:transcriptional regulator with XRE-family HTH domain
MMLSTLAAALDGIRSPSERPVTMLRMADDTLGERLKEARMAAGLSLRDVEREVGVRSGHLSQMETGTIAKPELAILWDLASLYGIEFAPLLVLAGHGDARQPSARQRQRMTVALRAMQELTPAEQADALRYMAELKARRDG